MTMHGFRATVISQLKAAGFDDSSVALRSRHRDFRSLSSYHNLRGSVGQQQQAAIYGETVFLRAVSCKSGKETGGVGQKRTTDKENDAVKVLEPESGCLGKHREKRRRGNEAFYAIQNMSGQITRKISEKASILSATQSTGFRLICIT
ncbi:hypothetical protein FGB62_254g013 [Gracilaria domingensis]|nr:hypothetical protein FGB62_254g013 [Gracilaria domingensis]